jgi:hypothetical protein
VDSFYTAGRTCPQLTAPLKYASLAAPVVASGAALLIDLGHNNPELSTDPVLMSTINRSGDTIYNAERAEVINAALMAGVDRVTRNTVRIDGRVPNITDYRADSQYLTDNGLDRRYGAGQLNIYNSYFIIAGGEQNSQEDANESKGRIGDRGFDYDPYFGGLDGSNSTASYYFTINEDHQYLWASLVWNIKIEGDAGLSFNTKGVLYDLDISLYYISESKKLLLLSSSNSSLENFENLWTMIDRRGRYLMQVKVGEEQIPFIWDYALAWRIGKTSGNGSSLE